VEELPQIVAERAKAFGNIDQLTVLNGAEGMTQLLNQVVGAGISTVPMLRQLLSTDSHAIAGDEEAPSEQRAKPVRQRSSRP
jgi:flotillin